MDEARKAITFVIPKHGVDTLVGWIRLRVAPGLYTTSSPALQDFLRNYPGVTIRKVLDFIPPNSGTSAALPQPAKTISGGLSGGGSAAVTTRSLR